MRACAEGVGCFAQGGAGQSSQLFLVRLLQSSLGYMVSGFNAGILSLLFHRFVFGSCGVLRLLHEFVMLGRSIGVF